MSTATLSTVRILLVPVYSYDLRADRFLQRRMGLAITLSAQRTLPGRWSEVKLSASPPEDPFPLVPTVS
jgi:hypothetical protein